MDSWCLGHERNKARVYLHDILSEKAAVVIKYVSTTSVNPYFPHKEGESLFYSSSDIPES